MSYPLNAPITFVNTNGGADFLDFEADGPTTNLENKVRNFVVTTAGDILYRANSGNNDLERLPIGSTSQILTVSGAGLPSWQNSVAASAVFTAYVTASTAGIPTSRSGGANSGTWFLLGGNTAPGPFVTWSTASPGSDPDGVFITAAGANYGQFSVPTTGIYSLDSLTSFDPGTGVNAGAGLPAGNPSGTAVRQARLVVVSGPDAGTILATASVQVSGSNTNYTTIALTAVNVALSAGDYIGIQVRHDRNTTNTCTIGASALPSQTYFSGKRVH